ncbi:VOC family protein [Robertkochia solimangrovi]|nr:VOC family protein [Robertkochia solimangrovi]
MVGWFEIPVNDMDRAKQFYESVFRVTITVHDLNGLIMGWFPDKGNVPGAQGTLIKQKSYIPGQVGVLIYFNCTDLQEELDRVVPAGGKLYQPKTMISPEHGYMGVFIDTEGNRIALHSLH